MEKAVQTKTKHDKTQIDDGKQSTMNGGRVVMTRDLWERFAMLHPHSKVARTRVQVRAESNVDLPACLPSFNVVKRVYLSSTNTHPRQVRGKPFNRGRNVL